MYTYQRFEFPFFAFCNFSQYIFNKILTQISQSWVKHAFYIHYTGNVCPLWSMLLQPYYAQNNNYYAAIIGSSLMISDSINKINIWEPAFIILHCYVLFSACRAIIL